MTEYGVLKSRYSRKIRLTSLLNYANFDWRASKSSRWAAASPRQNRAERVGSPSLLAWSGGPLDQQLIERLATPRAGRTGPREEETPVDAARQQLNASDCKNGTGLCDHAHLSVLETKAAVAAEDQRNTQNCENGWDECDHSKLTASAAKQVAHSEQQRNFASCKDGLEVCDYAKLTPAEAKALADAEHKRNYAACLKGYGYCDPSRLTAEEVRTIHPGN